MYIINAFISGILFFAYLIVDSWWWILGFIVIILLSLLDTHEINEMYMDDEREIL